MSGNKKGFDVLEAALLDLDAVLAQRDLSITIKAMGGFALLARGVRTDARAYTSDIDTVTPDYAPEVRAAIHEVAERHDLDTDWLNNDGVMGDAELVESMIQAKWEPLGLARPLRAITLLIATVPTLTRAKRLAAQDMALSGRMQDAPDLVELVAYQGIGSLTRFDALYPDPWDEYPTARDVVARWFAAK